LVTISFLSHKPQPFPEHFRTFDSNETKEFASGSNAEFSFDWRSVRQIDKLSQRDEQQRSTRSVAQARCLRCLAAVAR
jgi:hypothetical protein